MREKGSYIANGAYNKGGELATGAYQSASYAKHAALDLIKMKMAEHNAKLTVRLDIISMLLKQHVSYHLRPKGLATP